VTAQSAAVRETIEKKPHPYGQPLNIMSHLENQSVAFDYDALNTFFTHPEVSERKVVAVSIFGAFRRGKSFLMDYALRFMYANVSQCNLPCYLS